MRATAVRRGLIGLVVLALVVAAGCRSRGPEPTEAALAADAGPFAVSTLVVAPTVDGFGGGTIWYPTEDDGDGYGLVAVAPGYLSGEDTIAWYGPRIASHGFVVITIATNSTLDLPASRGNQLLAALDHVTLDSPLAGMVDASNQAVMGWSMGGGGSLEAAADRPSLRAAVPLAPWNLTSDWSQLTTPTLVVGCEADAIAPVAGHAEPFYESIPTTVNKAYIELDGASHQCVTSGNGDDAERDAIIRQVVPWLKRFLDGDGRYEQFLCPPPAAGTGTVLSEVRAVCPLVSATTTTSTTVAAA